MDLNTYQTLRVRTQGAARTVTLYRPESNNALNGLMITELHHALDAAAADEQTILVIEGLPECFCVGADFEVVRHPEQEAAQQDPEALFDLWNKLASGPYITVAHVRGRVNAGGIGFVAAADIAVADERACFSLSELLFGLLPATLMPFLIRKVGYQRANFLALTTHPISAAQAQAFGLIDAFEASSADLLRRYLLPLRRLSRTTITRHKAFMAQLAAVGPATRSLAVETNRTVFSDPANLAGIARYVSDGTFPWEKETAHGR